MDKLTVVQIWRKEYLPGLKENEGGTPDYPARCESWGMLIDSLCKSGEISEAQYESWSLPAECRPVPMYLAGN